MTLKKWIAIIETACRGELSIHHLKPLFQRNLINKSDI
ncbi:hypothetical protein BFV94_1859 [Alteromonas macleodii]|uniref:Transcriptional regulator n=1 Tax=Alteromonas macleodii TaxID=28108 RepID=A0AB36FSH3_ALTMA|nr:hypothetical protein BFV95_1858 [Alteromonas macleodii]OES32961.1 hypothetical protein BFV94_1859 [Alteromonas macleodii]OES33031.1 hypothetical protein BFV93_1851 [Alteromonas macleodii]OES41514.1 hypothetical protein BFV96_1859 [Alteromonas macleodii]